MILKSEGRFVEITILRRSFPEHMNYVDGNWLDAEIKIDVPGFKGLYGANLRTNDFECFFKDLEKLQTNQSSIIEFTTLEDGLYLKGILDITGNIQWYGTAKSSWGNSCLTFLIESDYASIDDLFKQTRELLKEYPVIGTTS